MLVTGEDELKKALYLLYETPLTDGDAYARYLRQNPDAVGVLCIRQGKLSDTPEMVA